MTNLFLQAAFCVRGRSYFLALLAAILGLGAPALALAQSNTQFNAMQACHAGRAEADRVAAENGWHNTYAANCTWLPTDPNVRPHGYNLEYTNETTIFGPLYNFYAYGYDYPECLAPNIPGPGGACYPPSLDDRNQGEPDCPAGGCPVTHGNPINAATGNKFQHEVDFTGPGLLRFDRFYNSLANAPTHLLGPNWTNTYTRRISTTGSNTVKVGRPDGKSKTFTLSGDTWQAATGEASRLLRLVDGGGNLTGWTYREHDDREIESFDALGRLTAIARSDGSSIALAYNGGVVANGPDDYLPTSITDQSGRKLSLSYGNHKIVQLVDPSGATYGYAYDGNGRLSVVTYAGGGTKSYLYNESAYTGGTSLPYALTGIVDEKSQRFATFAYQSDGRAVSTEHAGGVEKFTMYYAVNGPTSVTTPSGIVEQQSFVSPAGVFVTSSLSESVGGTTRTHAYTYDANGKTDVTTDATGVTTDHDFNARGLVTQRIDSANQAATKRTLQTDWLASFDVPSELRILDASNTLEAKATWTYNTRGQLLSASQVHLTNAALSQTTTYSYCEPAGVSAGTCPIVGLPLTVNGPRTDLSDTTTITYRQTDEATCSSAPSTCPYRKGDLWKVANAKGHVSEILRYDGAGRVLSSKDANGIVTDLEYNTRGWLIARKLRGADNNSEADDATTRLEYDATGAITKVTEPDGTFTSYIYDAAHRLTVVTDALGNSIHYTLNNASQRIQEDSETSDSVVKHSLSRVYDTLGQLQTAADAYATPTDFTYDVNGQVNTVTDALFRVSDNDYDALGRLKQTIANVGGSSSDKAASQFGYDARDNLRTVVDPKGLITSYTYDSAGNVTQLSSPDTGSTLYGYNAAGDRISELKADNVTQSYAYDELGRLTARTFAHSAQNIGYVYDVTQTGCLTGETFSAGQLTKVTDANGYTRYCYDNRGNRVRVAQTLTSGSTLTVGSSYNAAGRVIAMTYPSGAVVVYLRDASGRVTRVDAKPTARAAQVTLVGGATYLPFGPLGALTFGNYRVLTKSYDQNYGIDSVNDSATSNPLSEDFMLDAAGNITGLTERASATTTVTRSFTYDGLGRLTAQKNGASTVEGFTYDSTGNRLSRTAGSASNYSYSAASHRLTAVGAANRSYNATGETLSVGSGATGKGFTFDDDHRLATASVNGLLKFTNLYNGLGQRVGKRTVPVGNSLQFVYDDAGHLLGEYTSAGVRIKEYVWLDDTLVAVLGTFDGKDYHYVETDHLGTPRAVVHPTKNTIEWRWDLNSSAFGEHLPDGNPDGDSLTYALNLRFPGQYFDSETGTNYNYFRDYDPSTGRYLESDPIGLSGGVSTYGYAGGAPISHIDASGLFFSSVDAACMQDPSFCVEMAGRYAQSRATIARQQCDSQGAEYWVAAGNLFESAERPAVVATLLAAVLVQGPGFIAKAPGRGYDSFSAFKKAEGLAGKGNAWHHIVEQTTANLQRFGAQAIHNTDNLVVLPHGPGTIHNKISAYYSSIQQFTNKQTVNRPGFSRHLQVVHYGNFGGDHEQQAIYGRVQV